MDSTVSQTFLNNSAMTAVEVWFIPVDILSIICITLDIIPAALFLMIILLDKTCWTVPMMLVANSALAELMLVSVLFSMATFTLQNDLKQIQYQDSLCILRGYLTAIMCAVYNYSYLLQSIYRYIIVVYPARLFWQSARVQIVVISLTWVFSVVFSFPVIFTGDFTYNVDNQIYQLEFRLSFAMVFEIFFAFILPVSLLIFIYFKLVRYVQQMNKRITPANTLLRAQRELKMVRRAVILIMILSALGIPYTVLILMSFFTDPPKYHYRIANISLYASRVSIMITLFQFTDPVKASIKKILNIQPNAVIPTSK
jgi:hypothetical protein